MKDRLIAALHNIGTGTVESVQLVSNAMQSVTTIYSDLKRSSQRSSIELTNKLVDRLSERTVDGSQEELIEAAVTIFSTIENIFEVRIHLS